MKRLLFRFFRSRAAMLALASSFVVLSINSAFAGSSQGDDITWGDVKTAGDGAFTIWDVAGIKGPVETAKNYWGWAKLVAAVATKDSAEAGKAATEISARLENDQAQSGFGKAFWTTVQLVGYLKANDREKALEKAALLSFYGLAVALTYESGKSGAVLRAADAIKEAENLNKIQKFLYPRVGSGLMNRLDRVVTRFSGLSGDIDESLDSPVTGPSDITCSNCGGSLGSPSGLNVASPAAPVTVTANQGVNPLGGNQPAILGLTPAPDGAFPGANGGTYTDDNSAVVNTSPAPEGQSPASNSSVTQSSPDAGASPAGGPSGPSPSGPNSGSQPAPQQASGVTGGSDAAAGSGSGGTQGGANNGGQANTGGQTSANAGSQADQASGGQAGGGSSSASGQGDTGAGDPAAGNTTQANASGSDSAAASPGGDSSSPDAGNPADAAPKDQSAAADNATDPASGTAANPDASQQANANANGDDKAGAGANNAGQSGDSPSDANAMASNGDDGNADDPTAFYKNYIANGSPDAPIPTPSVDSAITQALASVPSIPGANVIGGLGGAVQPPMLGLTPLPNAFTPPPSPPPPPRAPTPTPTTYRPPSGGGSGSGISWAPGTFGPNDPGSNGGSGSGSNNGTATHGPTTPSPGGCSNPPSCTVSAEAVKASPLSAAKASNTNTANAKPTFLGGTSLKVASLGSNSPKSPTVSIAVPKNAVVPHTPALNTSGASIALVNPSVSLPKVGIATPTVNVPNVHIAVPVHTPTIRTPTVNVPTVRTPTIHVSTITVRPPTIRLPTVRAPVVSIRVPTIRVPTVSIPSDIRLKRDIVELGQLPDGLHLYRYRYIGSRQRYVGVMAQEVAQVDPDAVTEGNDGFLRVNYTRLGLNFMTWGQWLRQTKSRAAEPR